MVKAVFTDGNIEVENEAHGVVVEKISSSSSAGVVCRSAIEVNIVFIERGSRIDGA